MNLSQQMAVINHIEQEIPVDTWKVAGINIWPFIRIDLGIQLSYQELRAADGSEKSIGSNKAGAIKVMLRGLAAFAKAAIVDFPRHATLKKHTDAVFFGDQVSRIWLMDSWYDRFCDPFISNLHKLKLSSLHLEPLHDYRTPRYSPGRFIQAKLDILKITARLQRRKGVNLPESLKGYEEYTAYLEGQGIKIEQSLESILNSASLLRLYADYFKRIFIKVKPRIGFVVSYYSLEGMAFNLACREYGIPSVDIQHGVQGDFHCAYGLWNRVPQHGYSLLPRYFWCWSELEGKAIEHWNQKAAQWHQPIVGGNPWLNLWQDEKQTMVKSYQDKLQLIDNFIESKARILITLQPGVTKNGIPDWLLQVINNSPADWLWLIRLHPCMLNEQEAINLVLHTATGKINIDDATDFPLPILLRNINVHITHSSSTVLEAQQYGIPSIVFSEMGLELYHNQVKSGWVNYAGDTDAMLESIRSIINNQNTALRLEKQDDFTVATLQELISRL